MGIILPNCGSLRGCLGVKTHFPARKTEQFANLGMNRGANPMLVTLTAIGMTGCAYLLVNRLNFSVSMVARRRRYIKTQVNTLDENSRFYALALNKLHDLP